MLSIQAVRGLPRLRAPGSVDTLSLSPRLDVVRPGRADVLLRGCSLTRSPDPAGVAFRRAGAARPASGD